MSLKKYFIIYCYGNSLLYGSEEQKLADFAKQQVLGTQKPCKLDKYLEKRFKQLKERDPEAYNKLILYAQKQEIITQSSQEPIVLQKNS